MMQKRMKFVPPIMISLLVVMTGCTKLGPDFVEPDVPLTKSWTETDTSLKPETLEHRRWWSVFDDAVLDRLIGEAYAQNLPLRAAGLRILEARANYGIAAGRKYPQVQQLRVGAAYQRDSENAADTLGTDGTAWNASLGFDSIWELDLWGRFRRGIESAEAALHAVHAGYGDVAVSLTAEVARTYVAARTFEERLALAAENITLQQRSLGLAQTRFENGDTNELDVQQARVLLNQTRASVPRLQMGLRQAQNALATLLAKPVVQIQRQLAKPGKIPTAQRALAVGIPADLLRRRPDIRRAEFDAAAQTALVGVAETDLYPRFTLTGSVGLAASAGANTTRSGDSGLGNLFSGRSLTVIAGPSVQWNIFNFGRLKNNVRVQDARLQQLLAVYQDTVLRAVQETEDSIVGYLRSQDQVTLLAESVSAAKRSVDLSLIQYQEGSLDYQRVLDSQDRLLAQQDQWTQARSSVSRYLIATYKAIGGGWDPEKSEPFLPEKTLQEMRGRTDWGDLLTPTNLRAPTTVSAHSQSEQIER